MFHFGIPSIGPIKTAYKHGLLTLSPAEYSHYQRWLVGPLFWPASGPANEKE